MIAACAEWRVCGRCGRGGRGGRCGIVAHAMTLTMTALHATQQNLGMLVNRVSSDVLIIICRGVIDIQSAHTWNTSNGPATPQSL